MMDLRPATWADVESVLARLSEANRVEYSAIGFPGQTFNLRLLKFLMAGETRCIWFDDQPQAFIAIAPQNNVLTTWVGVTDACLQRGHRPIRLARDHLRDTVARQGPITSFLTSSHPNIRKWMELLGFALVEETPTFKVYRCA